MVEPLSSAAPPRTSVIAAGILPTTTGTSPAFDSIALQVIPHLSIVHCFIVHFVHFKDEFRVGTVCNELMNNQQ
jgi:hypothetical protein